MIEKGAEFIADGSGGFYPVSKGNGTHFFNGQCMEKKKRRHLPPTNRKPSKIEQELIKEEQEERERKCWDAWMEEPYNRKEVDE